MAIEGAIIGIIVGAVAIFIFCVCALCWCCGKCCCRKEHHDHVVVINNEGRAPQMQATGLPMIVSHNTHFFQTPTSTNPNAMPNMSGYEQVPTTNPGGLPPAYCNAQGQAQSHNPAEVPPAYDFPVKF